MKFLTRLLINCATLMSLQWRLIGIVSRAPPLLCNFQSRQKWALHGTSLAKLGLNIRFYVLSTEKAHCCTKPHVLAYFASKSVHGSRLWRVARTPEIAEKLENFRCAKSRMRGNQTHNRTVVKSCTEVGHKNKITSSNFLNYWLICLGVAEGQHL